MVELKGLFCNDFTREKGLDYYQSKKLYEIEERNTFDREGKKLKIYSSRVQGNSGNYTVSLVIDGFNNIVDASCTCPAFLTYPGHCKHIAALASYVENSIQITYKGVEVLNRCMDAYREISTLEYEGVFPSLVEKQEDNQVKLKPVIHIENRQYGLGFKASLSLMVGNTRMYVVKNLMSFCEALMDEETIKYGQQLEFKHSINAFQEESRPFVQYIKKNIGPYVTMSQAAENYAYYIKSALSKSFSSSYKEMILEDKELDELVGLLDETTISIDKRQPYIGYNSPLRRVNNELSSLNQLFAIKNMTFSLDYQFKRKNQKLTIEVEANNNNLVTLTALNFPIVISGKNSLVLLTDNKQRIAYITDSVYAKDMKPIYDMFYSEDCRVTLDTNALNRFCSVVYPKIRKWVEFTGDSYVFDNKIPENAEFHIYLDAPKRNLILASPVAVYDDIKINLLKENNKNVGFIRDLNKEGAFFNLVSTYFDHFTKEDYLIKEITDEDFFEFVEKIQPRLQKVCHVFVSERFKNMLTPIHPKMSVGVSVDAGLLRVTFDMDKFPPDELMGMLNAYKLKKKFYRLKDGTLASFNDKEVDAALAFTEAMELGQGDLKKGEFEMPKFHSLFLDKYLRDIPLIHTNRDENFKKLINEIQSIEESNLEPPDSLKPVLRDYQKEGFRFIKNMTDLGFGCILADDMGLGKTLEMISVLLDTKIEDKNRFLALVVCPASLVYNWKAEIEKFASTLKTMEVIGSASERAKIINTSKNEKNKNRTILITSYDLLRRDVELYDNIDLEFQILDEAQYIKNASTKNAKAVKLIKSNKKVAMTGTPIENRLSELWSIFDFLMRGYLGSYFRFREHYENPIMKENDEVSRELLNKKIMPFVLRRLKENVLTELPEKNETAIAVNMDKEQEKLYMANLAKIKLEIGKEMKEGKWESSKLQILAMLTRLRQICCHPSLCYENYKSESGKLEICIELIREAVDGGHKILLFSQFTSMLDIIKERLVHEKIEFYMLTGKTDKLQRINMVNEFNENEIPVFLISLKAGGTGLNLTGADTVIHYDPWWNLSVENQATDRAHRIGQENNVQVYKLITKNTIEEKIQKLQEQKRQLQEAIITENSALLSSLNGEDLVELLEQ